MELSREGLSVRHGEDLLVIRAGLAVLILALGVLVYQISILNQERSILFISQKWTVAFGLGIIGASLSLVALAGSWTPLGERYTQWFTGLSHTLRWLGFLNLIFFLFSFAVYLYLILGPQSYLFKDLYVRLCVFALMAFAGAVFLKSAGVLSGWMESMILSWLLIGAGYKVTALPDASLIFIPDIATYPFSLGWSEASRYYYASLFSADRIYGIDIIPSVLHPSRYLMQAVPFLISGLPLWVHRVWQVILWLTTTVGTTYLLARRLAIPGVWMKVTFIAWAALYLFQGPVYYHLLVPVAIVLLGFDSRKFWRSLIVVLVASFWAGISRINWFPVPGLLVATIHFLETPMVRERMESTGSAWHWKEFGAYLVHPLLWLVLGTLTAFGSQTLYVLRSGADPRLFTSSFTSDLLWYRLWPNPTYTLGILPAVLLVSAPLLLVLILGIRGLHPIRVLGIASVLSILFAGGVVVSTKIGGGSNLHNLDAFLTLLLGVGSYVIFRRVVPEPSLSPALQPLSLPFLRAREGREVIGGSSDDFNGGNSQICILTKHAQLIFALVMFVPIVFALNSGGPVSLPEGEQVENTLTTLNELTKEAVQQGGEVLFISQRHLLTFGYLPDVPLVEKYENVFLMEMVMGGNEFYLSSFYDDINHHRFALIISDQQGNRLKGSEFPFGEENDVWVKRVTQPLLEHYRRKDLLKHFGIEVLEPIP